jgi:hypothetical protein
MKDDSNITRFEELVAGHVMADLDPAERAELDQLGGATRGDLEQDLDRIAAQLEIEAAAAAAVPMPAHLVRMLESRARELAPQGAASSEASPPVGISPKPVSLGALPDPVISDSGAPRRTIFSSPWPGWAAAACLAGILAAQWMIQPGGGDPELSPAQARAALLESSADLVRVSFQGTGDYELAAGDIVWSDARQEGFMELSKLPPNNPGEAQYQLWIVDPDRDEFPVDGGVFDVPASDQPVVIPVRSRLPVSDPTVFVITLEQPGGVVRSKQETVVAVAKP